MRATHTLKCLVFCGASVVATSVLAAPTVYRAVDDDRPGMESTFTFDFGGGFVESARISDTDFQLELDADAASARFLTYEQTIGSINLPNPTGGSDPIPTGEISVEILPNSSGTGSFDPLAGVFSTSEIYRVHFTGDLSAFGITESFVDLPSNSQGTVDFETGSIRQEWEGSYIFSGTNVRVDYTCEVNAMIVPEPAGLIGMYLGLLCLAAVIRRGRRAIV